MLTSLSPAEASPYKSAWHWINYREDDENCWASRPDQWHQVIIIMVISFEIVQEASTGFASALVEI